MWLCVRDVSHDKRMKAIDFVGRGHGQLLECVGKLQFALPLLFLLSSSYLNSLYARRRIRYILLSCFAENVWNFSLQRTLIGLARDLRGIAFAFNTRTSYMMLFDWMYPCICIDWKWNGIGHKVFVLSVFTCTYMYMFLSFCTSIILSHQSLSFQMLYCAWIWMNLGMDVGTQI